MFLYFVFESTFIQRFDLLRQHSNNWKIGKIYFTKQIPLNILIWIVIQLSVYYNLLEHVKAKLEWTPAYITTYYK